MHCQVIWRDQVQLVKYYLMILVPQIILFQGCAVGLLVSHLTLLLITAFRGLVKSVFSPTEIHVQEYPTIQLSGTNIDYTQVSLGIPGFSCIVGIMHTL